MREVMKTRWFIVLAVLVLVAITAVVAVLDNRLSGRDGTTYADRAYTHIEKEEWDKAIRELDKAIKMDPDDGWAYNCRGYAYVRKEEWENAIRDYTEAIRIGPEDS